MEDLLRVGVISSTHGIAGEVKVFPTTDDVKRFKKLKRVILVNKNQQIELDVSSAKFFKNMVILKFDQFNNIDDVQKFRGAELYVTRDNAVSLAKDEYFICDLIGMQVVSDEGVTIGTLTDVMQTGANDVYVVENSDKKEILFPAIKECILKTDVDNKTMTVHVMEGLLDL